MSRVREKVVDLLSGIPQSFPTAAIEAACGTGLKSPRSTIREQLLRLERAGEIKRVSVVYGDGAVACARWAHVRWTRNWPMDFEDAKQMILRGVPFGDVFVQLNPEYHELFKRWYTDETRVPNLVARTACPVQDGKSCQRCGGFLVRTGTCETCQSCGDNSGCG